ncbi:phosphodiesterase [Nisaea acidiphila]|uniref:Phosphodiesterase n=1 Tax=Nisaea acidiphila TaxID=1862145 RepID=A0A9J7AYM0_9PROT|nr:phosphodiesterase [Nisaea acidiphila]UUX51882.1 phosphodiesterase [Nisaea acidiphila]
MLLAEITDTHLMDGGLPAYDNIDTKAFLEAAVETLSGLTPRPDALLVAGDVSDDGTSGSYRVFRDIVGRLGLPTYVIPGNHDARENMRSAFAADGYLPADGHLDYVAEIGPLSLVALDTLVEGEVFGVVEPERRVWLENALHGTEGRPTIVMLHHPPFITGTKMDEIGCRDGDSIAAVIEQFDNVEIVLSGHFHRSVHRRWAGTTANICSSTAHQVGLNLAHEPGFKVYMEPPQVQLLHWQEETGLAVHQVPVGTFECVHASE